jgi:hypothetical protein
MPGTEAPCCGLGTTNGRLERSQPLLPTADCSQTYCIPQAPRSLAPALHPLTPLPPPPHHTPPLRPPTHPAPPPLAALATPLHPCLPAPPVPHHCRRVPRAHGEPAGCDDAPAQCTQPGQQADQRHRQRLLCLQTTRQGSLKEAQAITHAGMEWYDRGPSSLVASWVPPSQLLYYCNICWLHKHSLLVGFAVDWANTVGTHSVGQRLWACVSGITTPVGK